MDASPELSQPKTKAEWVRLLDALSALLGPNEFPSVSELAHGDRDPFRVLVATLLSLRTKDEVTIPAAKRLFEKASTPKEILKLSNDEIAVIIYPVGFFRTKAQRLRQISAIIVEEYDGKVPTERQTLLSLPGVGLKTANLVLALAYGQEYICVDTHVHRIANRLAWIRTKKPNESEAHLARLVPSGCGLRLNELLVLFGQKICKPISPFCSQCPLQPGCPQIGVVKKR